MIDTKLVIRHRILTISDELIIEMLKGFKSGFQGQHKVVENGLPEDAWAVSALKFDEKIIGIVVSSSTFSEVPCGHEVPVLDSPILQSVKTDLNKKWLCGQFRHATDRGNVWDFQGIFITREEAIKACKNENYFIVPIEFGKEIPGKMEVWENVEYPLREAM